MITLFVILMSVANANDVQPCTDAENNYVSEELMRRDLIVADPKAQELIRAEEIRMGCVWEM